MSSPFTPDSHAISHRDLDRHIAAALAGVKNPDVGIFGPDTITWRINREAALFLGAGRAALLQLAHPWVSVSLDQHSSLLAKPVERFHKTFRVVFTMIFGSAQQAVRIARSLYQRHTYIKGEIPSNVAAYQKGSHYQALHIPALLWVYGTLIDSAIIAYQAAFPPLRAEELAGYYAESKILAGLFGIPPESLPADWPSFQAYISEMCTSQALGVDDRARAMGRHIITGASSRIPIPRWYQELTAAWLPARFRQDFMLPFGADEQLRANRAQCNLPRFYRMLPRMFRYVGPFQEAQARLAGRTAGYLTRRMNRFWIGQTHLPFND